LSLFLGSAAPLFHGKVLGAAIAQRHRAVDIGGAALCCGQVILTRHAGHRGQHPRFVHAAGAQLAVDHGAAGGACLGALGCVVDFAHAITILDQGRIAYITQ
jgi:hypothetical protein